MGMFDYYIPDPPLHCPVCNSALEGWQGKDGPCMLLIWQQESKIPVAHKLPEENIDNNKVFLESFVLPSHFEIYTDDCKCERLINAYGFCEDEVWCRSEIVTHLNFRPGYTTSEKDEHKIRKDLKQWIENEFE